MARPVVGIIGNSYLMNDQYPVHAAGRMNVSAISAVAGCAPMIIPACPEQVDVAELLGHHKILGLVTSRCDLDTVKDKRLAHRSMRRRKVANLTPTQRL